MTRYRQSQLCITDEIEHAPLADGIDRPTIETLFEKVRRENRELLTEPEAKQVLAAARVPVIETRIASTPEECVLKAREIGYPIVLKIISPQISHKSDVGGVALDLKSDDEVINAATSMSTRINSIRPDATLAGFSVQQMVKMPSAHELIIGATTDVIFGPIIMFGHGGTAVEVMRDHSVALPPITPALAKDMVSRTRVSKLLAGYRDRPKANLEAIYQAIVRVSNLVLELPDIEELDINPLFANDKTVTAIDARIKLRRTSDPN